MFLMLTVAACRKRDDVSQPAPDPNTPVPVEVENHYQGDVTIYLARGSMRQRLGMVTALGAAEFTFPWRWLSQSGSSRLLAYPIAGARAHDDARRPRRARVRAARLTIPAGMGTARA